MIERLYRVGRDYIQFAATVMILAVIVFALASAVHAWPLLSMSVFGIINVLALALIAARKHIRSLPPLLVVSASRLKSPGWILLITALILVSIKANFEQSVISPIEFVHITQPQSGGTISVRGEVAGKVSRSVRNVWIVVCPQNTGALCVVQPRPVITEDGNWRGVVYFGQAGVQREGNTFVIRALVDPKGHLNEGMTLDRLPESKAVSEAVVVRRK